MFKTKQEIEAILHSSDTSEQHKIAEKISALAYSDKVIDEITQLFADPVWKIRKVSADILIKIGASVLDHLDNIHLEENEDIVYWSLYVLGNIHTPKAAEILEHAVKNGSKTAKIHGIKNLLKHDSNRTVPILIFLLNDGKWSIRKAAADALCEFGKDVVNDLLAAFSHGTDDQKYWLIRCIGKVMGRAGIKSLTKFYRTGNPKDRYYAILALGEIKEDSVIPIVIEALGDSSWLIRKQASETLILYGDKAVAPLTKTIKETDNSDIHYWSFQIIAKILGEKFIPFLKKLLQKDNNINIRTYITIALGQIDCEESLQLLIQCFSDPCWLIRKQAHEILVSKGSKALTPLILKLDESFDSQDENICHWTLKTILKMENFALAPLKKLAESENPKIRLLIIQLLQEFKNIKTIELLLDSLNDESWPVRNTAANAIIEFQETIYPHIDIYFKKHRENITANQCFWIKKIFHSIQRIDLYEQLCKSLEVDDLNDLFENEELEKTDNDREDIELNVSSVEQYDSEKAYEENSDDLKQAKVSGDMIRIVNNIIKDSRNEFSDMRLIAIKNIFQINEQLNDELLRKLYDQLMKLMADEHKTVRIEAQKAFAFLDEQFQITEKFSEHNEEKMNELIAELSNTDEQVVINALIKMQSFKCENTEKHIAQTLRNTNNIKIQKIAIETLGNIKSEKYEFVLIPFLQSPKPDIIHETLLSLCKIGTEKCVCAIISVYAENRDIIVRLLPDISESLIVSCCSQLLDGDDIGVKVNTLKLLTEIYFNNATDLFVRCLEMNNLTLNKIALYGIQAYNNNNIITALKDIIESTQDEPLKEKIKETINILISNKQLPSQLPSFKEFCAIVEKKGTFKIKPIDIPNTKEHSTIDSFVEKAKKITSSMNKGKEDDNEIENIQLQLRETEFLIGKHIYDLFKKRKLTDMKLSKIVYDIDKLNNSIEKRMKKIESGDIKTSGSSEKLFGIDIGKIKDNLNKKNIISELKSEVERIQLRKNQNFVKLFQTGLSVYIDSDCSSEDLDKIIKNYNVWKEKLEKLKLEAELIST